MRTSPLIPLPDGRSIPQLGYGVWQVPPAEAADTVQTAIEVGYRSIDTAKAYENEEGTGEGLRRSGIPREELFVTTKLWNSDQGYDQTLAAFDASMERLGLEYLDLYLIHWPVPANDLYLDTWRAFEQLVADGRVRSIGVANFLPHQLERLIAESSLPPVLNQIELHPHHQAKDAEAADRKFGVVTETWSPLGRGRALDDPTIRSIAARIACTPAQVVLAWHLQRGWVTIPKSATPSRIKENFQALEVTLSSDDVAAIDALDRGEEGRIGPHPDRFNVG